MDIAAQPMTSAPFVSECLQALQGWGFGVTHLDLAKSTPPEVRNGLSACNSVFVTGGFPAFLLERAQKTGFLDAVRDQVASGLLAYIGVSAGAGLAGPDLTPLIGPDDPGQVKDTRGLGLVDFVVVSHVNRYPANVVAERSRRFNGQYNLKPVKDDEAVAIVRGEETLVASP